MGSPSDKRNIRHTGKIRRPGHPLRKYRTLLSETGQAESRCFPGRKNAGNGRTRQ
jgi:hypothetical protein